MGEYSIVLVTCGSLKEAEKISESLVLEKLAACVNLIPKVRSLYFWEGKLCDEEEVLLVIKTQSRLHSRLEKRVKEMHSYRVPEVISWPLERGSKDYLKWVREATSGKA